MERVGLILHTMSLWFLDSVCVSTSTLGIEGQVCQAFLIRQHSSSNTSRIWKETADPLFTKSETVFILLLSLLAGRQCKSWAQRIQIWQNGTTNSKCNIINRILSIHWHWLLPRPVPFKIGWFKPNIWVRHSQTYTDEIWSIVISNKNYWFCCARKCQIFSILQDANRKWYMTKKNKSFHVNSMLLLD